jgi:broad specificity phosphatase PhoE
MLADRLKPWLAELAGEAFVVAHGGVARALLAMLAGAPPNVAASADIWQGRALIFDKGGATWVG